MIKRLFSKNETVLGAVIVILAIIFTVLSPQFASLGHLFSIGRSGVVIGLMALGLLTVLITGGIDVSVSATGVASLYITTVVLANVNFQGPYIVAVLVACLLGAVFGAINAVLVTSLRLPSLIVTLGTLTLYQGGLLAFVGTVRIRELPAHIAEFSSVHAFSTVVNGRAVSLHLSVVLLILLAVVLAWLFRSTSWGRSVYAIGDNEEAASRLGVNVQRVRFTAFVLAGTLAGLAGIISASLNRMADPFSLVGTELEVLAAVVLGGASVTGGRGSVVGTMLGVLLISMVGASLVLIGIPTAWRQVFVGFFLLLGLALPAIRRIRRERKLGSVVSAA